MKGQQYVKEQRKREIERKRQRDSHGWEEVTSLCDKHIQSTYILYPKLRLKSIPAPQNEMLDCLFIVENDDRQWFYLKQDREGEKKKNMQTKQEIEDKEK